MTKTTISLVFIMAISAIFSSCYPEQFSTDDQSDIEDNITIEGYIDVDERLWSYFDDFVEEAANRDIDIDLNALEITGTIENIPEAGVAGTCTYGQHIHHVTIDNQVWNNASAFVREMIIFHELGHCALNRGHEEASSDTGACLSIMNSGTTNCRVLYNNVNKEYYLDELFSLISL